MGDQAVLHIPRWRMTTKPASAPCGDGSVVDLHFTGSTPSAEGCCRFDQGALTDASISSSEWNGRNGATREGFVARAECPLSARLADLRQAWATEKCGKPSQWLRFIIQEICSLGVPLENEGF
jgi:hypothetical protein